jgi:hypothetical protein
MSRRNIEIVLTKRNVNALAEMYEDLAPRLAKPFGMLYRTKGWQSMQE